MSDINNVSHNADKLCFETTVDGHRAHLDYRTIDEDTLDFHHTFVPDELRGRGVAADLTEAALAYAEEQGFKVHPSCSYVETFMKRKGIPAVDGQNSWELGGMEMGDFEGYLGRSDKIDGN